jgi:hypothetical protein
VLVPDGRRQHDVGMPRGGGPLEIMQMKVSIFA